MKDVVWTLIVCWIVYKVIDLLKQPKHTNKQQPGHQHNESGQPAENSATDTKIRTAIKKRLNEEGEYVDFEELNEPKH